MSRKSDASHYRFVFSKKVIWAIEVPAVSVFHPEIRFTPLLNHSWHSAVSYIHHHRLQ